MTSVYLVVNGSGRTQGVYSSLENATAARKAFISEDMTCGFPAGSLTYSIETRGIDPPTCR